MHALEQRVLRGEIGADELHHLKGHGKGPLRLSRTEFLRVENPGAYVGSSSTPPPPRDLSSWYNPNYVKEEIPGPPPKSATERNIQKVIEKHYRR